MEQEGPIPVPDNVATPISIEAFDAIIFTFFALAALTTAVRVFLWSAVLKSGVLDNVLIVAGTLLTLVITILCRFEVAEVHALAATFSPLAFSQSGGLPTDFQEHFNRMYRFGEISTLVYLITLPLIKCAILAFYRKIVISKRSLYFLYILAFVFLGQGIGNFIATIVEGEREGSIWNILDGEFRDPTNTVNQIVNSSFQILFDIILLSIPIPILWRLRIRNSAKVGLFVVYAISFVSLAATIIRLVKVREFYGAQGPDSGVLAAQRGYWTLIELDTAIFCANLPALSSLLRLLRGRLTSSTTASGAPTTTKRSHPTIGSGFRKRFANTFVSGKSALSTNTKNNTKMSGLRSGASLGKSRGGHDAYENIDSFTTISMGSADEQMRHVRVYGGGKELDDRGRGGVGDDGGNGGWPLHHSRSRPGVTIERPTDGIQKTYEFSAVLEKGGT